jgi:type I restriction enzyme S subunit
VHLIDKHKLLSLKIPSKGYNRHYKLLKEMEIIFPSCKQTQRSISKVLRTIQDAIEIRKKELNLQRELKDTLMAHLFTYGTKNEPLKQTEIGFVPESWDIVPFENLCHLRKESIQPQRVDAEYKYIGLEHIDSRTPFLTRSGYAGDVKSSKYRFYHKDILFGKLRAYLQKAVLADAEGICTTDILVFSPKTNIDPFFLLYSIHSNRFMDFAKQTTSGTNHPRTSWASLRKLSLANPQYTEQQEIGRILMSCDKKIKIINKEIIIYEELFQAMLEELMSGKISTMPLIENCEVAS